MKHPVNDSIIALNIPIEILTRMEEIIFGYLGLFGNEDKLLEPFEDSKIARVAPKL